MDDNTIYDLFIVGGGINGAGIALAASSQGLQVFLAEMNDFASGTSSSSTKLIHGGLRYLENYDFCLVQASLQERNILQNLAPHIIWPMEFILINNSKIRNSWLIRVGLFIYDMLAIRGKYNKTKAISLQQLDSNNLFKKGYVYTDLWVDDTRLVILNLLQAKHYGAKINKKTFIENAVYNVSKKLWNIKVRCVKSNSSFYIQAKYIINAAGPWVNKVLEDNLKLRPKYQVRLIKGSHIVLPKLYNHLKSYVLQNNDGRIIFVIPYEDNFTLIGTTEVLIKASEQEKAEISEAEIDYLLACYNQYFKNKITKQAIVYSYSGVRPLFDEAGTTASENTREYKIDCYDSMPLINIYGGKITTYRVLANQVIKKLSQIDKKLFKQFEFKKPLNQLTHLPGGDFVKGALALKTMGYDRANHAQFIFELQNKYPWLNNELASRYVRTYGDLVYQILLNAKRIEDLGYHFGHQLYQREVDYLLSQEYADCAEDILFRRTKLGLYLNSKQTSLLQQYIDDL